MRVIDFYFDFLSPYGYLASTRIEAVAARHACKVNWRPFRLGIAVVKVMGLRPNMETPLKGPYILKDIMRLAKVFGLSLAPSPGLPNPLPPAQLFYSAPPDVAPRLAEALFRAHWADGRNIGDVENLIAVGRSFGINETSVREAVSSPEIREILKERTEEAIARGVFGSPTFAVGAELFWGVDRLWLLDHYLSSGDYAAVEEQDRFVGQLV